MADPETRTQTTRNKVLTVARMAVLLSCLFYRESTNHTTSNEKCRLALTADNRQAQAGRYLPSPKELLYGKTRKQPAETRTRGSPNKEQVK